ncbi:MAG: DUF3109 family protein [Melioribacteraceae bacterium]|nr:DUF3109 family protein [Melioribacteraceae bacterium]
MKSKKCIVVKSYKSDYPNPLKLIKGAKLKTFKRKSPWKGWIFCEDKNGVKGWVPKSYLQISKNKAVLLKNYDATELTVKHGEILKTKLKESGWFLCEYNAQFGWIPEKNVVTIDEYDRPVIDGIIVDLEKITSTKYKCDPNTCKDTGSCCSYYEITFKGNESENFIGLLGDASKFSKHIKPSKNFDNIFDENEDDTITIDHDKNGTCKLAYKNENGCVLCSLHSVSLKHNLKPFKHKPSNCSLFPLALSEDKTPVLSIQEDALRFPCTNLKKKKDGKISKEIKEIIIDLYGKGFLRKLEICLEK